MVMLCVPINAAGPRPVSGIWPDHKRDEMPSGQATVLIHRASFKYLWKNLP
jgi:hypothetical protein